MADLHFMLGDEPAYLRHEKLCNGRTARLVESGKSCSAEGRFALILSEPSAGLVDDPQRRLIAALGVTAPGEQPMLPEHDAAIRLVPARHPAEFEAEVEARALPWQETDFAAEYLFGEPFGILRRGDGNHRIGMNVIDVLGRNEGVQRRIDGSRPRVEIERAMVEIADHLVFMLEPAVKTLQRLELLHIESRETVEFHRAEIPARSLDP